jgi:hypothetical protein
MKFKKKSVTEKKDSVDRNGQKGSINQLSNYLSNLLFLCDIS